MTQMYDNIFVWVCQTVKIFQWVNEIKTIIYVCKEVLSRSFK